MELLIKQIARAEQSGEKLFAELLRDIVLDNKRQENAVRVEKEKLRNLKLVDADY